MKELTKAYEPQKYEEKIYQKWEQSGFFNPDVCVQKGVCDKNAKPFTIVLPPPNATGSLHIGHAMMLAIEDLMIRYHRMKGDKTLWVPGTDHAAIATNAIVEKQLAKEGKTKNDLGREKYIETVKDFIKQSQYNIRNQVRKMGSSLDWSREAYTWDEDRNLAVRTMFKKMYDDGLIYRGYRIVNWCPHCHSTLADDEVEYKEEVGKFYWIKYGPFVLATARPETKLGDTAVAVHPNDKRYKKMVGKKYMIEGVLGEFEVKVVADEAVDMEFGTGAVKVTPYHSFTDYEIAQRHGLPGKQVIDEDGKMMANCGKYAGLTTRQAREAIVADMQAMGLIDHIEENYVHNVGTCYRCGSVIEPIPSKQWFVDVNKQFIFNQSKSNPIQGLDDKQAITLKKLMQQVVSNGQIAIIPDRFNKTYFHWIDHLRDWCISRQIWVGHQVPVWYKKASKGIAITFIRHGESQSNLDKVGAGHSDSPLTAVGKENAKVLGSTIDVTKFDVIFSSDLVRAKETAEIIFGKGKAKIDRRLREIDFGDITGKDGQKINQYRLTGYPNGESYHQVRDRVLDFFSDLIDKHDGQKIAIVAHSGTWKAIEGIIKNRVFDYELLSTHATRQPVEYGLNELVYVGIDKPSGESWVQDPDTLDTWFSSGLWTFSTLGWPKADAKDLQIYHPTAVLETMFDILFFWVARMIMMTTYALGEVPFKTVYLHARVLDKDGEKMSKSKPQTMIDPLDVCQKYGTDAVRLSLLLGVSPGSDVRLSEDKIAGFRNFTNKLWNICRFALTQINTNSRADILEPKTLADKWILERLENTRERVTKNIEEFGFSYAGEVLRDFTWNDLADWYLEIAKIEGDKSEVLRYILETILKLWHPFMPFVTEQIWSEVLSKEKMLMVSSWPVFVLSSNETSPNKSERGDATDFELIQSIITGIRSLRAEYKIDPAKKLQAVISAGNKADLLTKNQDIIKGLARLEEVVVKIKAAKPAGSIGFVQSGVEVYIDMAGVVDLNKEKKRLDKEVVAIAKYIKSLTGKLANAQFVDNAPESVVEAEKKKLTEAKIKEDKLKEQLTNLK